MQCSSGYFICDIQSRLIIAPIASTQQEQNCFWLLVLQQSFYRQVVVCSCTPCLSGCILYFLETEREEGQQLNSCFLTSLTLDWLVGDRAFFFLVGEDWFGFVVCLIVLTRMMRGMACVLWSFILYVSVHGIAHLIQMACEIHLRTRLLMHE